MIITRNTVIGLLSSPEIVRQLPELLSHVEAYRAVKTAGQGKTCCGGKTTAQAIDVAQAALAVIKGLSPAKVGVLRGILGDNNLYVYEPPKNGQKALRELGN